MKHHFHAFFSGVLVSALVFGSVVSALAATGRMTIEVDPINIQVNGQTFAPTDVNGNEVPVFAYNGTTYAPLRALAEAYGLEVGYDPERNMATVSKNATPSTISLSLPEKFESFDQFSSVWQYFDYDNCAITSDEILADEEKINSLRNTWNNTPAENREKLMVEYAVSKVEEYNITDSEYRVGFVLAGESVGEVVYYVKSGNVEILKNVNA